MKVPRKTNLYLLHNLNAGYIGNSPIFWAERGGYTQWIDDAKRWTWQEARAQIRSSRSSHSWRIWKLSEIEAVAKRTVDIQDLQRRKAGGE
jgi:hypothetical protein